MTPVQTATDWITSKETRVNKTAPPAFLSTLILMEWRFDGLLSLGLRVAMDRLELDLAPLHDSPDSRLMTVVTSPGVREWAYYAADFPAFMRAFNDLMRTRPLAPIKITYSADPDHQYWTKYRENVSAT